MKTIPLIAGQNTRVGTVTVSNDAENIYVRYTIDVTPGTLIYDLHAHIALTADEIPHNDGGLIPGQFACKATTRGVIDFTFTVPILEAYRDAGTVWGAAHATAFGTLRATSVVESKQGPKKNGMPVDKDRSVATNALIPDCPAGFMPGDPITFFTLGAGGYIIVDFGQALDVAQYPRVTCWEVTYQSPQMLETAQVDVCLEKPGTGTAWTELTPQASNGRPAQNLITASTLEVSGIQQYRYVRVTDTTPMVPDPTMGKVCYEDGFDLDGIGVALPGRETAWALTGETLKLDIANAPEDSWGQVFSYQLTARLPMIDGTRNDV